MVYGRQIDGRVMTFGTTGYTHDQTFLLYDRSTRSTWYPLHPGQMNAVSGTRAGRVLPFEARPQPMRLSQWLADHPNSLVLVGDAAP